MFWLDWQQSMEDHALINHEEKNRLQIVLFTLDEPRYALRLSVVERVVRAVEITILPKTPPHILGVINYQGQIIPVVDIRQRLHLPQHDLGPNDQFILAHTSQRLVALLVDSVTGIQELEERELVVSDQVLPDVAYIHGLAKLAGDLVLICDLDQFLSTAEEHELEAALAGAGVETDPEKRQNTGEAT